ncbi:MAG: methyltransferase domain-containing protein [Candidatus Liptonbacteria bacterium]|nr:methyltransferase domain-containing protein [Candidatus Liptonbacteria bacterium]
MKFLSETCLFVRQFLRNRREVGSVIPSSPFLVRTMLAVPSLAPARKILELGAGLGCMTEGIVRRMRPDASVTVVEVNPVFCRELRKRFTDPRVRVLNLSVFALAAHRTERFDCIISSIPLANFTPAEQERLVEEVTRVLAPDGVYVQYQYSLISLRLLRKRFRSVRVRFVPLNIPPAFVYICDA